MVRAYDQRSFNNPGPIPACKEQSSMSQGINVWNLCVKPAYNCVLGLYSQGNLWLIKVCISGPTPEARAMNSQQPLSQREALLYRASRQVPCPQTHPPSYKITMFQGTPLCLWRRCWKSWFSGPLCFWHPVLCLGTGFWYLFVNLDELLWLAAIWPRSEARQYCSLPWGSLWELSSENFSLVSFG